MQKCIKLRIIRPEGVVGWDELGQVLRDTLYAACQAANYVMREAYFRAVARSKDKLYCYPALVAQHPLVAAHILGAMERVGKQKWQRHGRDVLASRASLPTFRLGLPAQLHNNYYYLQRQGDDYLVDAQLCSSKCPRTRYQLLVAARDGSTRAVLDRLLSGQYKQGAAQLMQDRKRKWYIVIAYTFEPADTGLDPGLIMGVDLGVTKAATWAFGHSHKRGWIDGAEIAEFRRRVRARRVAIQNQGKYCGQGRIGHGTARRLLPVDTLAEKEANFRDTCNHRYAARIVSEAVRMGCGTIQLEDLSGIAAENRFLQNWTYYDLQTKIRNKAAEAGIRVVMVDPRYTSQRCSCCGHIDRASRPDQATFVCTACGYGSHHHCFDCGAHQAEAGPCTKCGSSTKHLVINADYNAARNLATAGIADIITAALA